MLNIILIRPGQTVYDEQGRIQGNLNIPLSEEGQKQAQELVTKLYESGISTLYHGPCQACEETATIMAKALRVKAKAIDELCNLNQGLWQGMSVDEVKHNQPRVYKQWQEHPGNVCPPQGEMLLAAKDRVEASLRKIVKKNTAGVIGIIVGEPIATIIKCICTGAEICNLWKETSASGTFERLEIEAKGWRNNVSLEPVSANKNP